MIGMNRKWLLLSLLIVVIILARSPFLASDVLGGDAAYHARAATAVLHGELLYRDVPYTYPPLYAYTEALSIAAFGNTTIGWKMVSQIYDLSVVILVYLIASRIFGEKGGLAAALLYGFSPLPFFATSSFACFDSTAAFWMLAGILLLLRGNKFSSAVALGVGAAYKYFPMLLLWPVLMYIGGKRAKLLYSATSILTVALFQLPFLFSAFSSWLENVILFHLNRPPMGASIYNLLFTLPPRLSDTIQSPFVVLSPIAVLLIYILVAFDKDSSEVGLVKKMALVMAAAVFFNKVVLFYALWFIPILCLFILVERKRNAVLTLVSFFVLQAALLLAWYFFDVLASESNAIILTFVYMLSSASMLVWLLADRIRLVKAAFRQKIGQKRKRLNSLRQKSSICWMSQQGYDYLNGGKQTECSCDDETESAHFNKGHNQPQKNE